MPLRTIAGEQLDAPTRSVGWLYPRDVDTRRGCDGLCLRVACPTEILRVFADPRRDYAPLTVHHVLPRRCSGITRALPAPTSEPIGEAARGARQWRIARRGHRLCVRCHTRYCDAACQHEHWANGHKKKCKKIARGGGAEQYHADKKAKEAADEAVASCAAEGVPQDAECFICGCSINSVPRSLSLIHI